MPDVLIPSGLMQVAIDEGLYIKEVMACIEQGDLLYAAFTQPALEPALWRFILSSVRRQQVDLDSVEEESNSLSFPDPVNSRGHR